MRRILLYLFVYFCITNTCYAAPCYGTKMPEQKELFCGLQTHSILNRYLEGENGKMRSLQNFVLISYGIFDWFCIDLKGGMGNIKQQAPGQDGLDYSAYLGGGYGMRIRLYNKEKIKAVLGFQHISIHPHKTHLNGIKRKSVLDNWQVSLLASYSFPVITPYIGTKLSRMDYIFWLNGDRNRVKSDDSKSMGLVFGCDIPLADIAWLNIEANFFDAEAFATSLNFRF